MRKSQKFSEATKLKAVWEIETGWMSKKGAARAYGADPASVRGWVRKYGNSDLMARLRRVNMGEENKRIEQLKRELSDSKLLNKLYERAFEITKQEFGIDLKKKFGTDLSKKTTAALPKGSVK